ncbi:hypothetical protein [Pseudomonas sp.]|nr:hypothetical protein [Pseudomonas sp.]HUE92908.1 hypothetical protein [Pseudomonas sp.]
MGYVTLYGDMAGGFDEDTVKRVLRLVDLSEYKQWQPAAPEGRGD